jgi:hypothetical protein
MAKSKNYDFQNAVFFILLLLWLSQLQKLSSFSLLKQTATDAVSSPVEY